MSTHRKRVVAIDALVAGSALHTSTCYHAIRNELRALKNAERVTGQRGDLLRVLHTTRALDTSLREFLLLHGVTIGNQRGLGRYLEFLSNHSAVTIARLPGTRRWYFQRWLVTPRNIYMHEASANPSRLEADRILALMHACLGEVLAL